MITEHTDKKRIANNHQSAMTKAMVADGWVTPAITGHV